MENGTNVPNVTTKPTKITRFNIVLNWDLRAKRAGESVENILCFIVKIDFSFSEKSLVEISRYFQKETNIVTFVRSAGAYQPKLQRVKYSKKATQFCKIRCTGYLIHRITIFTPSEFQQ